MKINYYLILLLSLVFIDISEVFGKLYEHFTFIALYFAFSDHTLAFFILFSYPYLNKKLSK